MKQVPMPALSRWPIIEEIVDFCAAVRNWSKRRPAAEEVERQRRLAEANYPEEGPLARVGEAVVHRATADGYVSAAAQVGDRLVQEECDGFSEDLRAMALAGLAIVEKAEEVESEADELRHSDTVKAHAIAVIRSDSFPIAVAPFSAGDLLREVEEYAVSDLAGALSLLVSLLQRREHPGQALHLVDRDALGLERRDRAPLAEYVEQYGRAVTSIRSRRETLYKEIDQGVRDAVRRRLRPLADGVLAADPDAYLAAVARAEEAARQAIGKGLFEGRESVQAKRAEAALEARRQTAAGWDGYDPGLTDLLALIEKHRLIELVPPLFGIVRRHIGEGFGVEGHHDLQASAPLPLQPLAHEGFWRGMASDPELRWQLLGSAADAQTRPFPVDGDDPIGGRFSRRMAESVGEGRGSVDRRISFSHAVAAVTEVLLCQHVYRNEAIERLRETERMRREYTAWTAARRAVRMVFSPLTRTMRAVFWH